MFSTFFHFISKNSFHLLTSHWMHFACASRALHIDSAEKLLDFACTAFSNSLQFHWTAEGECTSVSIMRNNNEIEIILFERFAGACCLPMKCVHTSVPIIRPVHWFEQRVRVAGNWMGARKTRMDRNESERMGEKMGNRTNRNSSDHSTGVEWIWLKLCVRRYVIITCFKDICSIACDVT